MKKTFKNIFHSLVNLVYFADGVKQEPWKGGREGRGEERRGGWRHRGVLQGLLPGQVLQRLADHRRRGREGDLHVSLPGQGVGSSALRGAELTVWWRRSPT